MHEWALAEAVVATARRFAQEQKLHEVTLIKVRLGELQRIEREIFTAVLQQLLQQEAAPLKSARLSIEIESARFRCRLCAREWSLDETSASPEECEAIHFIPEMAHVYLRCLDCSSPDFEIVQGRGVWLAGLEGM
ncbi:hydrogenase nickel incorporation protein HypA [Candidatus Acetothermia bacterium]|jgi:hydrogenase nickel incorporation protein HypA/HybF|nr:hydrogenase nickel incorporation protein HypA [Candidatus Acetothermia bacterium]MCI2431992.1 hydrogenase nickel incorporation protein HypA [Candidatus Acetothermia bacterium]MCI2436789.1 hydrogenase nickel incorporation protein HypA [Candidatus Acetothermia bacterium]